MANTAHLRLKAAVKLSSISRTIKVHLRFMSMWRFNLTSLDVVKAAKRFEDTLRNYVNHDVNVPLPDGCFVTLAFDECHHLASPQAGRSWSALSELRHALRLIILYPVFTIFLSTSGKLRFLSPDLSMHPSSRLSHRQLSLLPPLYQCPFDLVSKEHKFSTEPIWNLVHVASTEHIAHLGRPL